MSTGSFVAADACIEAWLCGPDEKCRQIAANIRAETALASDRLEALLNDFAQDLAGSTDPLKTWKEVCYRHQFRGARVPPPVPAMVGRAVPIESYVKEIRVSDREQMSQAQYERLLRRVAKAGTSVTPRDARILRKALLGRYVLWATFRRSNPTARPFDHLPRTTEAIRNALGMGHIGETETLVLMSYRTQDGTTSLELFRPTIGDAGDYHYYRPHSDPGCWHGMAFPLRPDMQGLEPLPEVVHRECNGQTLDFPLTLVE